MITVRLPNSYGGISYLGKGRRRPWRVRITVGWKDGKQIYKNLGYAETRKKALEILAEYHKTPYNLDRDKTTFTDIFNKWCEAKEHKLEPKNFKAYQMAYNLCSDIHNAKFMELRKTHLQQMMDCIDKSAATKRKIKTLLHQMYLIAMDMDVVDKDYSNGLEVVSNYEEIDRVPFSETEINKLWEISKTVTNVEDKLLAKAILILIYTGVRVNELLKLKPSDMHLEERYVIGGSKTDAGKNRIIPISEKIYPLVEEIYDENSLYFLSFKKGKKVTYYAFYDKWNEFMTEYKFDHLIHDTRVTFASLAHEAGVNELNLKRLLGHSNDGDVTRHYIKTHINLLLNEVNKI